MRFGLEKKDETPKNKTALIFVLYIFSLCLYIYILEKKKRTKKDLARSLNTIKRYEFDAGKSKTKDWHLTWKF